jgi:hypothetical protein
LALTGIDSTKLLDQIAVPSNRCLHKISAAFIRDTGRFVYEKAGDRLFVTSQQQSLQSLLGKQSSARLIRQRLGVRTKKHMVGLGKGPYSSVALKRTAQHLRVCFDRKATDER